MARQLSGRELGRRVGVSGSHIYQIENNQVSPSVATLYEITSVLGLSIDELLGRPNSRLSLGTIFKRASDETDTISFGAGIQWKPLLSDAASGVGLVLVLYAPGATSSTDGTPSRHGGRDFVYITAGHLELTIDSTVHEARAGDSLEFDASLPHAVRNPLAMESQALWINWTANA